MKRKINKRQSRIFSLLGWGLLCLIPVSIGWTQTPDPREQTPSAMGTAVSGALEFPTFGFSVVAPPGWQRVPEVSLGKIVRWVRKEAATGKIRAELMIEMEPIGEKSFQQRAEELIATAGGTISDKTLTLDAKPAFRIKLSGKGTGYALHEGILCDREKVRMILEVAAVKGEEVADALDALQKSWKWLPYAAPTAHLQPGAQPVILLEGQLQVTLPEIMRLFPPEPTGQTKMAIYDPRTSVFALIVDVQIIPNSPSMSLRQLRDSFTKGLQERLKLDKEVVWRELTAKLPTYLSETITPPIPLEKNTISSVRFGVTKLSRKRVLNRLQEPPPARKVPQFGIARGAIRYMSPDFDALLNDFTKYME